MTKLKANEPAPEEISPDVVRSYAGKISREKDQVETATGKVAGHFKKFEQIGGNKPALKLAMKLQGMEEHDAQALIRDTLEYSKALEVFKTPDLFDSLFQQGEQPKIDPASPIFRVIERSKSDAHPQQHQAGISAAQKGIPLSKNPNAVGCDHWQAWQNGWLDHTHTAAEALAPANGEQPQPMDPPDNKEQNELMTVAANEGNEAGREGKPKDSNPYDEQDARFPIWNQCWDKGQEQARLAKIFKGVAGAAATPKKPRARRSTKKAPDGVTKH